MKLLYHKQLHHEEYPINDMIDPSKPKVFKYMMEEFEHRYKHLDNSVGSRIESAK
jgi:hypothetical protein